MHLIKALPGDSPLRALAAKFLRKLVNFLYYDAFELLVIAVGVAVILLIWEFTFWH